MEMYAIIVSVAMGILQALSIDFLIFTQMLRCQRTYAKRKPSEGNIMFCLLQHKFSLLASHALNKILCYSSVE